MALKNRALIVLTFIAIICVVTFSTAAGLEFRFSGRSWGHGLGMSQYGAKGFAEKGYAADRILAHFYQKSVSGTVSNQTVRVRVATGQSTITLSSSSAFTFYDSANKKYSLVKNNTYRVSRYGTNRYKVTNVSTGQIKGTYYGPLNFKPGTSLIKLHNRNENGYSNVSYRKDIRVILSGTTFIAVNTIDLENYLKGVISREMPSSWPAEALKAQAIAARSYAITKKKNYGYFDLYTTNASQVYNGYNAETSATNSACAATNGKVRRYNGSVIQAFYFSSSGGKTENNENVWGGTPIAYLRGVSTPYEPANTWSAKFSSATVQSKLGKYSSSNSSGVRGTLQNLTVTKRGYSPRVVQVRITGTGGTSYISGDKLRSKLGMRSTWFSIGTDLVSPSISIKPSRQGSYTYQYVHFRGSVSPSQKGRTIYLQYYASRRWNTISKSVISSQSTYVLSKRFSRGSYRLRAYLPAYGKYRAVASAVRGLSVRPEILPAISFYSSSTRIVSGSTVKFTGRVWPNMRGKRIYLQVRKPSGWKSISSAVISSSSTYVIRRRFTGGTHTLRVYTPPYPNYIRSGSRYRPLKVVSS